MWRVIIPMPLQKKKKKKLHETRILSGKNYSRKLQHNFFLKSKLKKIKIKKK